MSQKPFDLVAYRQLLADFRHQMPAMIEMEVLKAKLVRERYVALKNAGFTEREALEIVKAWPAI